jgi:hypothetical protein
LIESERRRFGGVVEQVPHRAILRG